MIGIFGVKRGRSRRIAAFVLAVSTFAASPVIAQSNSCTDLRRSVAAFESNADLRNLQTNVQRIRQLGQQIQSAESQFVRSGCQAELNAGRRLTGECRQAGLGILRAREDYNALAQSIETGQGVAQRRERALQQIARFGCGTGSSARITEETRPRGDSPFQQLLDRLFGGEGRIVDDNAFPDYLNMSTLRSVCVRACDGYYWPVSFSTLPEYLGDDAALCASQCPGAEVELFYYNNNSEEPEDMVSLNGVAYRNTANAFRYRQEFDAACTCKAQINYGTIEITQASANASGRAEIKFGERNFPLPMRDPRARTEAVVVAAAEHIPLPRSRPARPGEPGYSFASLNTPRAEANPDQRTIVSGDRLVRVVGPDTPYAQAAAEGS